MCKAWCHCFKEPKKNFPDNTPLALISESDFVNLNKLKSAKKNNLDTIFLVSPNTSNSRLKKIAKVSTGFLYMVSVFGTTGVQTKIHKYTIDSIKNAKKIVGGKLPIGIGFGVSTPNDVKKYVSVGVDAVIVGSANLKIIENTPSSKLQKRITEYTKKLKRSTQIGKAT